MGTDFFKPQTPITVGGNDMIGQWMKAQIDTERGDNHLTVKSQYGNVYLRKN